MISRIIHPKNDSLRENELRFGFGENWSQYLESLDEENISIATESIKLLLDVENLEGKRFLDVGSGSGLFSLAARNLGADVTSFDFDVDSVECTNRIKDVFFPGDKKWKVEQGSILDNQYLGTFGQFDVVYAWGVLHHTGKMWRAIDNVSRLVGDHGLLALAIYNDQGLSSEIWRVVKRLYNILPGQLRFLVLWPSFLRLWLPTMLRDILKGRSLSAWRGYGKRRGMSPWYDVVDWVGGYPFEVAGREQVVEYFTDRHFRLRTLNSIGKAHGCNEYVFQKQSSAVSEPEVHG